MGASQQFAGFRFLLHGHGWVAGPIGVGARLAAGVDEAALAGRTVVQGAPMLYARGGKRTSHALAGVGFGGRVTRTRETIGLTDEVTVHDEIVPATASTLGWLWHDRAASYGPSVDIDISDFREYTVMLAFSVGGSWRRSHR